MDSREPPDLPEKDFIRKGPTDPYPMFLWAGVIISLLMLLWGFNSWYQDFLNKQVKENPFLGVTNRDFSLFLWENPEYMRVNASSKNGYLPGFDYVERVGVNPEMADQYAIAPPEILFRYHQWHRLLGNQKTYRPIPPSEFRTFLQEAPEWTAQFWPDAPTQYVQLISGLDAVKVSDMQLLPEAELPLVVRQAFIGWKNYFQEGSAINQLVPTFSQVDALIKTNPHYARNYWRNILIDAVPKYLQDYTNGGYSPDANVPADQLASFLKVALYNNAQQP